MFAGLPDNYLHDSPRRSWSALLGFTLQACALLWLFVLPLLYTQSIADLHLPPALLARLVGPPATPRAKASPGNEVSVMKPMSLWMRPPDYQPHRSFPDSGQSQPPGFGEVGVGLPSNDSQDIGFWGGPDGRPLDVVTPPPVPVISPKARVSRMMEGNLILRVQPQYPPLARQARVQGSVVLRAIISREGAIEHLQVMSGPPLLVESAIRAVRQWRYRPYLLNDEPLDVETQITVNFSLNGK